MFQLGEFVSMVLISILGSLIFLGGWQWPWSLFDESVPVAAQVALMVVKTSVVHLLLHVDPRQPAAPAHRPDDVVLLADTVALRLAANHINGLVLVYDWPNEILIVLSGGSRRRGSLPDLSDCPAIAGVRYRARQLQRVGSVL